MDLLGVQSPPTDLLTDFKQLAPRKEKEERERRKEKGRITVREGRRMDTENFLRRGCTPCCDSQISVSNVTLSD